MMMFWSLAIMLRGMEICVLFERVRGFYIILIEAYKDSKAFLFIVGYICYVFALVYSLLTIGDEEKLKLQELVLISFQEAIGEFNAPTPTEIPDYGQRMAFWFFFILFLVMTNIIGVNSLIAIIGDSYDKT